MRTDAEAEQARLREWCEAQLRAVESNRDALLGELAERRESALQAGDVQINRVIDEHKDQQAALRTMLETETQARTLNLSPIPSLTVPC